jgi:hypothetical protein
MIIIFYVKIYLRGGEKMESIEKILGLEKYKIVNIEERIDVFS